MSLKNGQQGSIRITTAVTGFNRDLYIQPWPPVEITPPVTNGNSDWAKIGVSIDTGVYIDNRAPDTEKDCGKMDMQSSCPPNTVWCCSFDPSGNERDQKLLHEWCKKYIATEIPTSNSTTVQSFSQSQSFAINSNDYDSAMDYCLKSWGDGKAYDDLYRNSYICGCKPIPCEQTPV